MNINSVKQIGVVHSVLKELKNCPLQEHENAPDAIIELFAEFEEGAKNLRKDDELILLTWLHLGDRTVLNTKPRNNPDASLAGIFSTRSPDRPNPIGIHFVKMVSGIKNRRFTVSGIEVIDQTPIIDIKPVLK